jgi:serine/threonine protein kinase
LIGIQTGPRQLELPPHELPAALPERGERITVPEGISILRDIARTLAFAHDEGVVHRDIKSENVLRSGGTAVVTDFGIAKAIQTARTAETPTNPEWTTLPPDQWDQLSAHARHLQGVPQAGPPPTPPPSF